MLLRFALRIDGDLVPITLALYVVKCSSASLSFLPEASLPERLYAQPASQVAKLFPRQASAAYPLWKIAVTSHRASRVDKPTTRPPSRPFSHRLREFVHKYQDSCATYGCRIQSDPGPCRCRANPPA